MALSKKDRNDAIILVAKATDNWHQPAAASDKWALAEVKKYSSVREFITSSPRQYIYTAYGMKDGILGYYAYNANTQEWLPKEETKDLFFKSNCWYY